MQVTIHNLFVCHRDNREERVYNREVRKFNPNMRTKIELDETDKKEIKPEYVGIDEMRRNIIRFANRYSTNGDDIAGEVGLKDGFAEVRE